MIKIPDICDPIKTFKDLIEFDGTTSGWCYLVEPLKSRAKARYLQDDYQDFFADSKMEFLDGERPETIVCHDYKGNYLCDKFVNGAKDWYE